jgi:hypothetical protein
LVFWRSSAAVFVCPGTLPELLVLLGILTPLGAHAAWVALIAKGGTSPVLDLHNNSANQLHLKKKKQLDLKWSLEDQNSIHLTGQLKRIETKITSKIKSLHLKTTILKPKKKSLSVTQSSTLLIIISGKLVTISSKFSHPGMLWNQELVLV